MRRIFSFGLCCGLSSAVVGSVGAHAAPPVDRHGRGALGVDDVCAEESGPCAVSALQVGSTKNSAEEKAIRRHGQRGNDWIWAQEVADKQMRAGRYEGDPFSELIVEAFAPRMVQHCLRYNAYFWPQMSFWSQEVLRRVEALPENPDVQEQKQLADFSRNVSFLMCDFWFDPRQGTNWSQPVAEYMNRVRNMPASNLELPLLDGWFENDRARDNLWSGDSCMFWASSLMCDVGYLARDLKGNKDNGDKLCWDEVQTPDHGFSVFGASLMDDRPAVNDSDADFQRPEYLQCQEKELTKDVLEHYCPMFGHYEAGYLNVSYWGSGFDQDSAVYDKVYTCQAKLGIPKFSPTTTDSVTHRPWIPENGGVELMGPPPATWKATYKAPSHDARWAFMHSIREATEPFTPECGNSWPCIFKTMDGLRKSPAKAQKILNDQKSE